MRQLETLALGGWCRIPPFAACPFSEWLIRYGRAMMIDRTVRRVADESAVSGAWIIEWRDEIRRRIDVAVQGHREEPAELRRVHIRWRQRGRCRADRGVGRAA